MREPDEVDVLREARVVTATPLELSLLARGDQTNAEVFAHRPVTVTITTLIRYLYTQCVHSKITVTAINFVNNLS